ncbi:MAG: exodeoxyribonuclease VII large subunit [Clostridia bacterium]|nr:exodeoxyribonuclease VII large subunit [Clostridia bacterium]
MLKTLSVSELSGYITSIFEAEELLQNIKVYGEVSGLSLVRGNLYFNLKDENSIMSCIMFGVSSNLIKEGDQILATGSMRYYSKGGKLNFYVSSAVPYGSGILYQKFLELKNKLELEGLFDNKNKKPLPEKINTIGVITSKTGAVLHDIQTVSHRRNPCLNIIVYPAKVQGTGAESTIIDGLKYFDKQKDIDVVIIARGGGSIEDLQPFNTEILAREIVKISKPVISAVGHETDFTICDFASSIRAATPSEGAELVAFNLFEKLDKINISLDKLNYLAFHLFDSKQEKMENLISNMTSLVIQNQKDNKNKFYQNIEKLKSLSKVLFLNKEHNLELYKNKLILLNPTETLNRGWVRLSVNNKLVSSVKKIKKNDDVFIELKDGTISAIVKDFKEKI